MTPERFEEIRRVFDEAGDLPAAEQANFLSTRCAADPDLRTQVERLLRKHQSPHTAIDAPALDRALLHSVANHAASLPDRIGPFRVIALIGQGGMGSVYEATQENPARSVAVKVIRADAVSEESMRRFAHEAQILGRLQHPGIACIYEGGIAIMDSGPRPYIAMELVRGPSLTAYAAQHHPHLRTTLELFARICDAADHAHQAGIVHRDLKPSNILIDASGQPKIVDFGVARAIDAARAGATMHTEAGRVIGTLTYMSPEQITGQNTNVDARSDVYSLGVMLFELLARRLPYDLRDRSLPEAARMLREDEPSRLSSISPEFRGDLETITAKALEKDPARRYASAGELAADLRRHLRDQPVQARPASTSYQLRKFARRHKELVAGVTAAFVVLVAGLAAVSLLAVRESRQRHISQRNEARARWESYRNCIAAADRSLRLHDTAGALTLLNSAPPELRGWEWRYLIADCDQSLLTIPAHQGPVTAALLLSNASLIVSAGADGNIRRWNATDASPLSTINAHPGGVLTLARSPDDRHFLSSGHDNAIAGWDATTNTELWRQPARGPLHPQAFFPDGSAVAVPLDSRIAFLDPATGHEVGALKLPLTSAASPAIDPTGSILVCELGQLAAAFDLKSGIELWRTAADSFCFPPMPGRVWLYSDFSHAIVIADARTGSTIATIADVQDLFAAPASSHTATRQGPTDIALRTPAGDSITSRLRGHTAAPTAVAFSPADARVVTGDQQGILRAWNSSSTGTAFSIPTSNDALIVGAVERGGGRAVIGGWGSVKLWDLSTGDELRTAFPLSRDIRAISFAPDARRVAAAGYDGIVAIVDADSATCQTLCATAPTGTSITSLAWSGDGNEFFAACFDGSLRRYRATDAAPLASLPFSDVPLAAIDISWPTGQIALINDLGRLWLCPVTIQAGTPGPELEINAGTSHPPGPGAVHSLAFDNPGERLAAGGPDGTLVMIDVRTRSVLWTSPAGGSGGVTALAFSPDGSRVFAGYNDASIHVLDVATGNDMLRFSVARTPICRIECSEDRLVVLSQHPGGSCTVIGPMPTSQEANLRDQHARIRGIVDDRFRSEVLLPEVVRSLESDASLSESDRAAAIRLATARGDHPNYLNSDAWAIVRFPGRTSAEYELALRRSRRACELRPNNHSFLNTRGIAEYRAGDFHAAAATLTNCLELQRANPHPLDTLVLAMVQQKLGDPQQARTSLAAARELMTSGAYRSDTEVQWFLAEAEQAIPPGP